MGECVSVPLFVAQEIGHTLSDENVWLPTVTIDVSQAPEVADLARVHAVEGIGDVVHMRFVKTTPLWLECNSQARYRQCLQWRSATHFTQNF